MKREIKARWELTSDSFQETSDVSVGCNWGWDGVDDEELLGDIDGLDALELGCGGGQDTVALAEYGATVTGVDLTRQQLHHARDLFDERDLDIDVVEGDITALPFAADEFDLAYNTYVFQWVQDLPAAFAEAHRVLRSDGRFVFSMPHPFFDLADPDTHEVVESYFDTGRQVVHDGREEYPDLVTYRRRVSDVYNALVEAGFDVERMLEPGSSDPDDYEPGPWGNSPPELQAKLPGVLVVAATAR
jgi:ubiquinone/menaquinone biosynthesis C-methylase UbiE